MLGLSFDSDEPVNVLCLGAHSDDIEIGCGGTLLHLQQNYDIKVTWIVLSASPERAGEAKVSAETLLDTSLERFKAKTFKESFFPYLPELKSYLGELGRELKPDLVFTHARHDRHQDHRTVSDLSWNTFRNHLVLEYEIPKFDGDLAQPNVFVPLSDELMERKLEHLETHFASQQTKPWYDRETFSALARLRGVECQSRYAEGFYGRKVRVK